MKSVIRWAVRNAPAMNILLIATLILGAIAALRLRREEFPEFELEIILISVPYPGASPDEVEQGVGQKIEEAVRSLEGIKKQTTVATEGACSVVLELESDVRDVQKILSEVRSEIDRIPSFPEFAEDPEIRQITMQRTAIQVGVLGPDINGIDAERQLRDVTERVRDALLLLPTVSRVELQGTRDYQIDVEISENTLRRHGLTLRQVADTIRRENLELPAGNMKTATEDVLLRGKNKQLTGPEIARIPLLTEPSGAVLTVGDLGDVQDDFADTTAISRINAQPGLVANVVAGRREDLLTLTRDVHDFVAAFQLPVGYSFLVFGDQSVPVRDRLSLLTRNGLQGLLLVFVVLAIFLEIRLAFWVALGIPASILGACCVLWFFDQTLNMLSMFSFLMALGIVVDDAIVIGENIYAHRQKGGGFLQAAISGTVEVLPSVAASVATTIIAFLPMMFVTGIMGKFFAVMPLAIIAMLIISLIESTFILPCHLAHSSEPDNRWFLLSSRLWTFLRGSSLLIWLALVLTISATAVYAFADRIVPLPENATLSAVERTGMSLGTLLLPAAAMILLDILLYPIRMLARLSGIVNRGSAALLSFVSNRLYRPALQFSLRNPGIIISLATALLVFSVGPIRSGMTPWIFFPKLDSNLIIARVAYPTGNTEANATTATERIEQAILAVNRRYEREGSPVVRVIHRRVGQSQSNEGGMAATASGSHLGQVDVELVDVAERDVSSQQIIDQWRAEAIKLGNGFPGTESLVFQARAMGPGGKPIEFKLLANADRMQELESAVAEAKAELASNKGVFDITDDSHQGKTEFRISVRDNAKPMGMTLADVAETVRASYYGEEVMRLQRGRHEVKLMVRYPRNERESRLDFDRIRIRGNDGAERPITEIAAVDIESQYAEINRIDQQRSITVTADVDQSKGSGANASLIMSQLRDEFFPRLQEKYPGTSVRVEGQMEQQQESVQSLFVGFLIAFLAMYVLLTMEFRSYVQPLIIMAVVPFGAIGAIWGHVLMDLPLTLFSVMGLVALTGVVVNDSIVLVDFINHQLADGVGLEEALLAAGIRRFRPVLLTSITTVAGVLPILTETSLQAQLLIPMVTSLAFGLMLATVLVLFLVPVYFSQYGRLFDIEGRYAAARQQSQTTDPDIADGSDA